MASPTRPETAERAEQSGGPPARAPASADGSTRERIPFEPALEGLRGFALLGMLCFHAEFSWAVGGFLPIPTFFTLSGYLITSLFLVEWRSTGRIDLAAFWARRFRRLMPAALLTLVGMSLFAAFLAEPEQLSRLRADVQWALFYAANWHFILTDTSYGELFTARSPVQHFWSLAIEEQFYLAFPLIAVVGLRIGSGSRSVFAAVLAGLTLASVFASVWLTLGGASSDRIYYGSDTRAAELLMGALLAVLLSGRVVSSRALRRGFQGAGLLAMIAMVALWSRVRLDEAWLYLGGFAAYSLLSVAVIVAAVQPSGPVRALLSLRPMRWIGRVSYGAYLFHWPIYLWLASSRVDLEPWPLFALRVAVTFSLAGLSYRFLESPIRTRRVLIGRAPLLATPLAFAAVLGAIFFATHGSGSIAPDSEDAAQLEALQAFVERMQQDPPRFDTPPSPSREVPRIAGFGDSSAVGVAVGLQYWLDREGRGVPVMGLAELGCGMLQDGLYRFQGKEWGRPPHCSDRAVTWSGAIERGKPDVAVVSIGPWEVCDRKLPGDSEWRHLGDPVIDDAVLSEMLDAVDLLSAEGSLVVWLTHPPIEARDPMTARAPKTPYPESDPARMRRLNELIRELPERRPGKVRVLDWGSYMQGLPGGVLDPSYRPDGTHLSPLGSIRLARTWLVEEILRLYREPLR